MPQNQPKSRCVFCGSTDYGKGCRFGPHKVHMHTDNPLKCSYCGSGDYGKGCRINPTSNLHVRGAVFNDMYKESMQSFLDNAVLLHELQKSFKDFRCYKLGIIDESGNKIKQPETLDEQASYTPFVRTIVRLKKYLGSKTELLEASNSLTKFAVPINESVEQYKKITEHRQKIDTIINTLYQALDEAYADGIALEDVKKLLNA